MRNSNPACISVWITFGAYGFPNGLGNITINVHHQAPIIVTQDVKNSYHATVRNAVITPPRNLKINKYPHIFKFTSKGKHLYFYRHLEIYAWPTKQYLSLNGMYTTDAHLNLCNRYCRYLVFQHDMITIASPGKRSVNLQSTTDYTKMQIDGGQRK